MKLTQVIKRNIDVISLFIFCIVIFSFLVKFVGTDISAHLSYSMRINNGDTEYPANFAFYFIINLLSGFSGIWKVYSINTVILLSAATVCKYLLSKKIIISLNPNIVELYSPNKVSLITLSLFFCFAIPDPFLVFVLEKFYLGRFVPMVWHNSTTILLFPFAIFLFWKQLTTLYSSYKVTNIDVVILNALVIANALIKPSFLFVYVPVTFLFLLKKYKSSFGKEFLLSLTPIITAGVIILLQTYLIYEKELGSIQEEDSGIAIGFPFKVLTKWIPMWYIPISLFLSYLLPIYAIISYKSILKYKPFLYSISLAIIGILLSAFVYESGPRMFHGNFAWQNIICTYLVFLSTISYLTPKILDKNSRTPKDIIMMVLLLLHSLSGIMYLFKIGLTYSYY